MKQTTSASTQDASASRRRARHPHRNRIRLAGGAVEGAARTVLYLAIGLPPVACVVPSERGGERSDHPRTSAVATRDEPADTIYFGGSIITMATEEVVRVEALAERDGRIVAVGPRSSMRALEGSETRLVDLRGDTLMPGFIDAHSHLAAHESMWGRPVLSPPPVGTVESIADLQGELRRYIDEERPPPGALVIGTGYDDSLLAERRHPTRADLDAVSEVHPIIVSHASGHIVAANSMAIAKAGYRANSRPPAGGVIRRDRRNVPNGVFEETAAYPFYALVEPKTLEQRLHDLVEVERYYASFGITTAQDGISSPTEIELLTAAAEREALFIDVVSYPRWDLFDAVLEGRELPDDVTTRFRGWDLPFVAPDAELRSDVTPAASDTGRAIPSYRNHLRFGGVKLTVDGSPQGKTAYLSAPYVVPPEGLPADYRGYPSISADVLARWVDLAYRDELQVLVHCNGDAAADMMLGAVRAAQERHGRKDVRPVMIHAQMIRRDQVDEIGQLGIVPSFFTAHTYYWGDWHVTQTVGPERAAWMSPTGHAASLGIRFSNHTDAPVVPPNQLDLVWTAVTRRSRSGAVIGEDQRIDVYRALRAITIDAAYQYFEEHDKGSLEVGKRADLVRLSEDPLVVDPSALREIRVLQTIKDGETVWLASTTDERRSR